MPLPASQNANIDNTDHSWKNSGTAPFDRKFGPPQTVGRILMPSYYWYVAYGGFGGETGSNLNGFPDYLHFLYYILSLFCKCVYFYDLRLCFRVGVPYS